MAWNNKGKTFRMSLNSWRLTKKRQWKDQRVVYAKIKGKDILPQQMGSYLRKTSWVTKANQQDQSKMRVCSEMGVQQKSTFSHSDFMGTIFC